MKLYTEEQLKNFLKERTFIREETIDAMCDTLTPIELPSDEEVARYMTSVWFADNMHRECFKLGAIWMKTQILNQNKS